MAKRETVLTVNGIRHDLALSEGELKTALRNLDVDGYLIVDDSSDSTGNTYMQVLRLPTDYLIEHRAGDETSHMHSRGNLMQVLHELLAWLDDEAPQLLDWHAGLG